MNFNFSNEINNFLKIILKNALKLNKRVFFVGGIVRDAILGIKTADIDILLQDNAIEFVQNLPDEIKIKSLHKDFATVKLNYNNIEIDIASTRMEKYPYSGCLPVVDKVAVSLEKDVFRRDFTINSLYVELTLENNEIKYELIDLVDGLKDIKNKTLRVLHENSYIDDPTRIIRGVDFKYRFGFDFSEKDKILIDKYLSDIDYENMSYDRTLKVFNKVLSTQFQDEIFLEIVKKSYYKILNKKELNIDLNLVFEICKKFNLSQEIKSKFFVNLLTDIMIEPIKNSSLLDVYKNFSKLDEDKLVFYFYKTNDGDVIKYYSIKNIKLLTTGDDLINLGFKQGVKIGQILNKLLNEKLLNVESFSTKDDEIDWVVKNCK